ncbi:MAG: YihY family inner membrane protein [Candidatus Nitrotoga sp.]
MKKINPIHFLRFLRFLITRFNQDRCLGIAASLTFTTLLSLVPLVTVAFTLFSAFPVFSEFSSLIKNFILTNMMPETGGKIISHYMEQFTESAAKLTAVGIGFLILTAMLMMLTIDDSFNMIWRVSRARRPVQRVLIYWAVLTLGPIFIGGSLSITSWLTTLSVGYGKQIPIFSLIMLGIAPLILTTLAFTLLYRIVPNRYVPYRHAFIGGMIGSLAFEMMNRAFAFYITNFPTYELVYGAFASVPIFLFWIYLSWVTVLVGAVIASSLSHWRSDSDKEIQPAEQLYYAICMLKMMVAGMHNGNVQSLPVFSRKLRIGFDSVEKVLDKLVLANIVRKLTGNGWALIRDAEHIKASELYGLFVFNPEILTDNHSDAEVRAWLMHLRDHSRGKADVTLSQFFAEDEHPAHTEPSAAQDNKSNK